MYFNIPDLLTEKAVRTIKKSINLAIFECVIVIKILKRTTAN